MRQIFYFYNAGELAWVSSEISISRDIFLVVRLKKPGKLVIRQTMDDGRRPRTPLLPHKDTTDFQLRLRVMPETVAIQIFTSTEPKEIKYAYI